MIDSDLVKKLVKEKLDDKMFLVEVAVNERNVINIFVDSYDGLTIEQCINISRHVEYSLNRDEEDFELQVSSPGLSAKFKVKEQYKKYVGRLVEVVTNADIKLEGIILSATEDGITLETSTRELLDGHKKKQLVVKQQQLKYNEIKSAKAIISFK
ncbi:MAG: ribosome maturation factor [Prolixibacteraceae bacterium]|nr:MAG: ribosome maturation factor [Prolixibacteraceae bacterium]